MLKNRGLWGRLALFTAALIWGTSFVVLKSALGNVDTMWTLAIRFSLAAAIMLIPAGRKLKNMDKRSLKGAVLMGVCLAAAYILQTFGLVFTSPGKNAFLTSTYCVLVPFMAWAIYKRKPTGFNITAAVLCVTGIGLVALNSSFDEINIGDILTLMCGIFYSLQIIMMEQYIGGAEPLTITGVQFSAAAVVCWLGALFFEAAPTNVPVSAWMNILYLSVMCTAACFFLQAWGMRYTPSATAAMLLTLEAVFGALISVLFFGEVLTAKVFIGFVLIFVAVVVSEAGEELFAKHIRKKA